MKPKTKFQKQVFEASEKLPPLTEKQLKWAYQNCFEHIGRRLKSGLITCLDCSHSWTDKTKEKYCTCPHCSAKLVIYDTKKYVFYDFQYFCILTVFGGFQVLRFFFVNKKSKAGEKATCSYSEVVQRWVASDGKHITIARLRNTAFGATNWNFSSPLEIRPERHVHNITPVCVFPRMQLISELKRSGFDGNFHSLTPFELFQSLLSSSRAETLLKTKQTGLLHHFVNRNFKNIDDYWASIKICIRNGYNISDASIWCDYIDLLRFFDKDLHNAKYVCPADLKTEHDKYVVKKREWQKRQKKEQIKIKALEDNRKFKEMKSHFFGVKFTDGLINVRVLESAEEVMQEGDALHHCVFANEYHLKPDTLLFSAYIGDKRLETVELSLSQFKVLQSRGACNKNTEYHDRIIELVNKNVSIIQKRLVA